MYLKSLVTPNDGLLYPKVVRSGRKLGQGRPYFWATGIEVRMRVQGL